MRNDTTSMIHQKTPSFKDCHVEPIAMTAGYDFDSASDANDRFSSKSKGNIYSRFTNPNVDIFQNKVSILENAEDSVAFSSGMAAYQAIATCFLKKGDHIILANGIFGTTTSFFKNYIEKFDVAISVSDLIVRSISEAINSKTKIIFIESPTNPLLNIIDIKVLSEITQKLNIILVVDNTLLSPIFQKPLDLGATLSLNSAGKFFDGLGRCVGGTVSGSSEYISDLKTYLRHTGTCLSPFNAWILSNSLDTLEIRMLKHQSNAEIIFNWLTKCSKVKKIYSSFSSQTKSELISNLSGTDGDTPVISFEVFGDRKYAWDFIDNLKLIIKCTNIGGSKTIVTHPASTTHGKYSAQEREKLGISDSLIRISVGLENPSDLIMDLEQTFASLE